MAGHYGGPFICEDWHGYKNQEWISEEAVLGILEQSFHREAPKFVLFHGAGGREGRRSDKVQT